jgi:primary-amine oxidase
MRCRVTSILACIGLLGQAYSQCGDCENDQPVATAPHKNIWLELSDQELESVTTYLTGRLNLTTLDEEEPYVLHTIPKSAS